MNIEKLGVIVRRYLPSFYGNNSDRLIAEWWLERPRQPITGETRRVTIPADSDEARPLREKVREEFLANIRDDFYVAGLERHGNTSDYIFVPGASHANLPN